MIKYVNSTTMEVGRKMFNEIPFLKGNIYGVYFEMERQRFKSIFVFDKNKVDSIESVIKFLDTEIIAKYKKDSYIFIEVDTNTLLFNIFGCPTVMYPVCPIKNGFGYKVVLAQKDKKMEVHNMKIKLETLLEGIEEVKTVWVDTKKDMFDKDIKIINIVAEDDEEVLGRLLEIFEVNKKNGQFLTLKEITSKVHVTSDNGDMYIRLFDMEKFLNKL